MKKDEFRFRWAARQRPGTTKGKQKEQTIEKIGKAETKSEVTQIVAKWLLKRIWTKACQTRNIPYSHPIKKEATHERIG